MCNYIKDGGEQCSMDDEPFCHHHRGTRQANIYHAALSAAQSDSSTPHGAEVCDNCETALRVVVADVSDAAFDPKTTVVSKAIACECTMVPLDERKTVTKANVPEGWYDE